MTDHDHHGVQMGVPLLDLSQFLTTDPVFWVWAVANFVTAVAYAGIPVEMIIWHRRIDLGPVRWLVYPFVAFISTCGLHHLRMPFSNHARHVSGWDAGVDLAMALASVLTHAFLVNNRRSVMKTIRIAIDEIAR